MTPSGGLAGRQNQPPTSQASVSNITTTTTTTVTVRQSARTLKRTRPRFSGLDDVAGSRAVGGAAAQLEASLLLDLLLTLEGFLELVEVAFHPRSGQWGLGGHGREY